MLKVLVASSKGGCGKTTVSTNLAAHFAVDGKNTVLVDCDRLGSSKKWCEHRAGLASAVLPIDGTRRGWQDKLPTDAERVVIDTPAGIHPDQVAELLDFIDAVVVPVLPSALDIEATVGFLNTLAKVPRVHKRKLPVGLVVNRSKPWTNASQQAVEMLKTWPYPVITQLRDTQAYVVMAGLGRSLFDYRSAQVREHQADWEPLLKWIKKA